MNRSLLLVVCDFLLLSILALARFDVSKDAVIAQDATISSNWLTSENSSARGQINSEESVAESLEAKVKFVNSLRD